MRAQLRIAAVLALLLGGRAFADGYSLSGSVGGGASRGDSWSSGEHEGTSALDWSAGLALAGTPFRPGLLQFLVGAQYASLRTYYFESRTRAENLGYRLQVSAFTDSPLSLSLGGARSWSEFTTDGQTQQTGATLATTYTGTAVLRVQEYPSLRLALTRTTLDNRMLGGEEAKSTSTVLSAGAAHSTRTQDYAATYDTSWNSGTWAETNYRSHAASFAANLGLTDTLHFRLLENYYLRLPTLSSPINPRYDNNVVGTGLQWLPNPRLNASLNYSYDHVLVTAPGAPTIEQVNHGAGVADTYLLTPDLTMQNSATFVSTLEAQGDRSASGAAETVGSGLNWRHRLRPTLQLGLGGAASVGVAEPSGLAARLAYGLGGTAALTYANARWDGSASYSAAFAQAQLGLDGWTLSQTLLLTGETTWRASLLRALLSATGERRQDPLLGAFMSRSVNASVSSTWMRSSAQLGFGLSDGLSASLQSPNLSDGLFLPAGYNTHTVFGALTGTTTFDDGHLLFTGLLRTMATTAPGRGTIYEHGLGLTAAYSVGLFTFSLDDRVSTGGFGGLHQTANLVMLRATRTFGMGF